MRDKANVSLRVPPSDAVGGGNAHFGFDDDFFVFDSGCNDSAPRDLFAHAAPIASEGDAEDAKDAGATDKDPGLVVVVVDPGRDSYSYVDANDLARYGLCPDEDQQHFSLAEVASNLAVPSEYGFRANGEDGRRMVGRLRAIK